MIDEGRAGEIDRFVADGAGKMRGGDADRLGDSRADQQRRSAIRDKGLIDGLECMAVTAADRNRSAAAAYPIRT
jgi:hypothetical protein